MIFVLVVYSIVVSSQDFALPFHDMVLPDPGFEDMHKVNFRGYAQGFLNLFIGQDMHNVNFEDMHKVFYLFIGQDMHKVY